MRVFLRILLETDGPYMPLERGGISHPGHVIDIAQCIAHLRGIELPTIMEATRENISQVYDNVDFGTITLPDSFAFITPKFY